MSYGEILAGKRVLVTGAGQGNGRAIAIGMAAAGAHVLVADINLETARDTVAALGGTPSDACAIDISDRGGCRAVAQQIAQGGPIDVLVNNAGILLRGPMDQPDADAFWDKTLAVNVTGTYNMVQAFLQQLRQTRGTIINVGSIQSFLATPNSAAYTASKGAVLQFTRALAAELAPDGIRVNGLAPGVMRTPMTIETLADDRKRTGLLKHVPMNRVGEPEELVGPAVFLASDMSSYVTGVMLPVDGGYLSV